MPAPYRPPRTARRPVPITDAEYELLRECCCSRMRGIHAKGHCRTGVPDTSSTRQPKRSS